MAAQGLAFLNQGKDINYRDLANCRGVQNKAIAYRFKDISNSLGHHFPVTKRRSLRVS